ncbi:hypothetical protein EAF00_007114 [Botryotinia globosa]|nr:hypothetical protein EAF00_007114 [Botryotinia globosa]
MNKHSASFPGEGSSDSRPEPNPTKRHGWQFWAIFPGLCLASVLCALDSTILSTALPTITADLNSSSSYVWIINAYTVTFTAIQPFYGQFTDIFGRKSATIVAICFFLLGSGICAGAGHTSMLISRRAVQGLGGGGLSILPAMVVCDLVSLRERQKYTGLIYGAFAIGTFIGPVVWGSMVEHIGWRWIFWLNLPIGGLALLILLYWASYFLPVYFQAVLKNSPQESGIHTLAAAIPMGFALATIAIGCFSILDQNSSTAVWVILQIVFAAGAGIVLTATLPAIQAPLPESDVANAPATWGFTQSPGFVCGVAIPSSIFEAKFRSMVYTIDDDGLKKVFRAGGAYEDASKVFITSLSEELQTQVVKLFVVSLKLVWEVGLAFAIFGLLAFFLCKILS